MQEETVILNGESFHIRRWGDPTLPVLLMLHGFPEYGGAWADLAPLLSDHFHCVAPDQRGYGQSYAPDAVELYDASHLVADMSALIGQLGGKAVVFGHDWGAAVAYGLAMRCPDQVDRLIIANGVHPVPFMRALAAGGAQSAASQYIDRLRAAGSEDALGADGFAKLLSLFAGPMDMSWMTQAKQAEYVAAWTGRLKTMIHWYRASPFAVAKPGKPISGLPEMPPHAFHVPQPHLLIWGDGDTALLPEATEGLEDYAPHLTRVVIEGADHWLCHQKPDEVAKVILGWRAS